MITSFILSKNRAAQLDVLLTSLAKNAQSLCSDIIVMWDATTSEFREGYELLKVYAKQLPFRICWWEQSSFFNGSFMGCLEWARQRGDFVLGLTDDTWFYRGVDFTACDIKNVFLTDTLCCSLRLGKNIKIQDCDKGIPISDFPESVNIEDKFYFWDWTKGPIEYNWYYPISLDGCIYKTLDLINMSKSIEFNDLRSWEGNLIANTLSSANRVKMFSAKNSHCVNIALNMVQYPYYNTIGPFGISVLKMNTDFLNGKRYTPLCDKDSVIGSHQYIELKAF